MCLGKNYIFLVCQRSSLPDLHLSHVFASLTLPFPYPYPYPNPNPTLTLILPYHLPCAAVVDCFLKDSSQGLHLGPCLTLVAPSSPTEPPPLSGSPDNDPSAAQEEAATQEACGSGEKLAQGPAVGILLAER